MRSGVDNDGSTHTRSPAAAAAASMSRARDSSVASASATAVRTTSSRLTSASAWRGRDGRLAQKASLSSSSQQHHYYSSSRHLSHSPHDMAADSGGGGSVVAAVHVLDSGVNRTPLPLQQRQTTLGVQGSGGSMTAGDRAREGSNLMLSSDPISSLFRSSFMMSGGSSNSLAAASPGMAGASSGGGGAANYHNSHGSFSSYAQAMGGSHRRDGGSNSNNASMELSTHSISLSDARGMGGGGGGVGGSIMALELGSMAGATTTSTTRTGATTAMDRLLSRQPPSSLSAAQQQQQQQAAMQPPPPMTEAQRHAWTRASTVVTLRETPTWQLYSHQDEVVPSDDRDMARAVTERNEHYRHAEEQFRLDEGSKHQSAGTLTLVRPKKSLHCEVHPPARRDAGPLQVTPWMLRDEWAQRLADVDDDDDDDANVAAAAGAAAGGGGGADKAVGGDDVGDVDDELGGVAGGAAAEEGSGSADSASADHSTLLMQSSAPSGSATASTPPGQGASSSGSGGATTTAALQQQQQQQWLFADTLLSNLRIMERAVVQNIVEREQLAYRGITMDPAVARGGGATTTMTTPRGGEDATRTRATRRQSKADDAAAATAAPLPPHDAHVPATTMRGNIRCLWCYRAPVTRHRSVTCMAWNHKEPDLLAVGYSARHRASHDDDDDEDDDGDQGEDGGAADGHNNRNATTAAAQASRKSSQPQQQQQQRRQPSSPRMPLEHDARGVVCCWSLKNPCAPELVLHLGVDAGVASLAFSHEHPSLLAVGNTEGGIVVYDMVKDVVSPSIVPTAAAAGLHTGAVWELRWVAARGKERGEFLLSISADGRVVQWAVGKTLERVPPDLMHLKRQPGAAMEPALLDGVAAADAAAAAAAATRRRNHHHNNGNQQHGSRGHHDAIAAKGSKSATSNDSHGAATTAASGGGGVREAVLSRQCGGMTFDVCPADSAIYLVGTEDGSVYECNRSQTESHEHDYVPHAELVYRVRWSPFSARYFLTCSADWTTRLYRRGQSAHVLRFDTAHQDAVQDVAWSYTNPLCFATVTAHGHVELWLVLDAINARASIAYDDGRRLSCVLFAEQTTPVLLVGDEEGDVAVYLLPESTYGRQAATDDEQEQWLEDAISKQTS